MTAMSDLSPAADVARLEAIALELEGVEAALHRLDDGSYGRCQVCGTALAGERLAGDPLATRCGEHA